MTKYPTDETPDPTAQDSVTIKVTVREVDDAVIQNAKVAVFLTSDRTEVMNTDTDASGIASTTYADPTPVEVEIRCRKAASMDSPRYVNFSSVQTIQSGTGLDFDVILVEDTNFNKPPH